MNKRDNTHQAKSRPRNRKYLPWWDGIRIFWTFDKDAFSTKSGFFFALLNVVTIILAVMGLFILYAYITRPHLPDGCRNLGAESLAVKRITEKFNEMGGFILEGNVKIIIDPDSLPTAAEPVPSSALYFCKATALVMFSKEDEERLRVAPEAGRLFDLDSETLLGKIPFEYTIEKNEDDSLHVSAGFQDRKPVFLIENALRLNAPSNTLLPTKLTDVAEQIEEMSCKDPQVQLMARRLIALAQKELITPMTGDEPESSTRSADTSTLLDSIKRVGIHAVDVDNVSLASVSTLMTPQMAESDAFKDSKALYACEATAEIRFAPDVAALFKEKGLFGWVPHHHRDYIKTWANQIDVVVIYTTRRTSEGTLKVEFDYKAKGAKTTLDILKRFLMFENLPKAP